MAVPKRRKSPSKSAMGASHKKVRAPLTTRCTNCNAITLPHRACPGCGFYQGRFYHREEAD